MGHILPRVERFKLCTDTDETVFRGSWRATSRRFSASVIGSQALSSSLCQPGASHSQAPVGCDRQWSPEQRAERWTFGGHDAMEPTSHGLPFTRKLQHDSVSLVSSNTERFVVAPRMHVLSNGVRSSRLIREDTVNLLLARRALRRLPAQCPFALEHGERVLATAQVSNQRAPLILDNVHIATCVDSQEDRATCPGRQASRTSSIACSNVPSSTQLGRWAEQNVNSSAARRSFRVTSGCIPAKGSLPPAMNHNSGVPGTIGVDH